MTLRKYNFIASTFLKKKIIRNLFLLLSRYQLLHSVIKAPNILSKRISLLEEKLYCLESKFVT